MTDEEFERKKQDNHRKRLKAGSKKQKNYLGVAEIKKTNKQGKSKYDPWCDS